MRWTWPSALCPRWGAISASRLTPLLVPVTINAIVGAEGIMDAMDLRAFGAGPRTWVHQLTYRRADKALIAAGALLFVGSTVLAFMDVGDLWVPELLLRLAAG